MRWILTLMLIGFVVVACGSGDAPSSNEAGENDATAAEPAEPQLFQGYGVIESIDVDNKSVTIAHEDIPGFMNAMTMAFDVLDPALFETVAVGDETYFVVVVKEDGSYFIERFDEIPR